MKKKIFLGLATGFFILGFAANSQANAISYSAAIIEDNPYAYWTLDGNAQDISGNELHGVLNGNLSTVDGAFSGSNSLSFDGNSYVEINGDWGGVPSLTIEAWFNVSDYSHDFQAIVSSLDYSFAHLQLNENGNNVGYTSSGGSILPIINENPLDTWNHVALVLSSGNSILYLNGYAVGSSSLSFSHIIQTSTIRIGSGHNNGRYFNGSIDDVAIYNYALSADQIQSHIAAANAPVPEPATMLLFGTGIAGLAGTRIRRQKK